MTHGEKMLACLAVVLVLGASVKAATADLPANPYQAIMDRNAFGLKPIPPPPDPDANKPPPQVPKAMFTGLISGFSGGKRALLKTAAVAAKGSEPAKAEQTYILAAGQREGDIEVLEINDAPGSESVKVVNTGVTMTLTFEKDGQKPTVGAAPPPFGNPGGVPPPPGVIPQPGGVQPAGGAPVPMQRFMRTPMPGGSASTATQPGAATPTSYSAGGTLPAYGATTAQTQPVTPQQAQQSAAQQMIEMELAREKLAKSGNPSASLIPPTPLSQQQQQQTQQQPTTTPAQNPTFNFPPRPPGSPIAPQ